jgi:ParB-like chromosome segregation protein Spo0J
VSTGDVVDLPVARIAAGPKVRKERIDLDHAQRLVPVLDACPPIKVREVGDGYQLVDGQHRLSAAKFGNRPTIRGVVLALSDAEAFVESVKSNHDHGLPLTFAERSTAAARMVELYPDWSDRVIANACAVHESVIAGLRPTARDAQLDGKRTGADGKRRPATKADQQAKRKVIADVLEKNPDWSLHRVAEFAGASPMTVASVRTEMEQKKSPGVGPGGPSVEPPDSAGTAPGDDRSEEGADPAPRHLAPVPDRGDEEPTPTVGDYLNWWPQRWAEDVEMQQSNAARDFARLMDRRMFRGPEAEDIAECCPVSRRKHAITAARYMADAWTALADQLEAPTRPNAAEV